MWGLRQVRDEIAERMKIEPEWSYSHHVTAGLRQALAVVDARITEFSYHSLREAGYGG